MYSASETTYDPVPYPPNSDLAAQKLREWKQKNEQKEKEEADKEDKGYQKGGFSFCCILLYVGLVLFCMIYGALETTAIPILGFDWVPAGSNNYTLYTKYGEAVNSSLGEVVTYEIGPGVNTLFVAGVMMLYTIIVFMMPWIATVAAQHKVQIQRTKWLLEHSYYVNYLLTILILSVLVGHITVIEVSAQVTIAFAALIFFYLGFSDDWIQVPVLWIGFLLELINWILILSALGNGQKPEIMALATIACVYWVCHFLYQLFLHEKEKISFCGVRCFKRETLDNQYEKISPQRTRRKLDKIKEELLKKEKYKSMDYEQLDAAARLELRRKRDRKASFYIVKTTQFLYDGILVLLIALALR